MLVICKLTDIFTMTFLFAIVVCFGLLLQNFDVRLFALCADFFKGLIKKIISVGRTDIC